jgi:hypothetical protein
MEAPVEVVQEGRHMFPSDDHSKAMDAIAKGLF